MQEPAIPSQNTSLRLAAALLALSAASVCAQPNAHHSPRPAIVALTTIGPDGTGYLSDPQPVRLAPSADQRVLLLCGTTRAVIRGAYPITPGSFAWNPVTIDAAGLRGAMEAAGVTVTNFQNFDLFQDDAGGWHAAVTIGVHSRDHARHWIVIAHAHPTAPASLGGAPLA